jgi:hypothetical protein
VYNKLVSAPVEDPKFLAWIKTLPCAVPRCQSRFVDPHHTGPRGLSQTASDRSAIPLCRAHHDQYHDKGRVWFEAEYSLNINAMVGWLNEKPRIVILPWPGQRTSVMRKFCMIYHGEEYTLSPAADGVKRAIQFALETAKSLPVWEDV